MTYDVNEDLVKGDELFLYLTSGHTVVAFATSCQIQIDGATISTANKMSCAWESNLAGKNSYSISADALYTQKAGACSFDALMAMMVAREAVDWAIGPCTTGSTCEGTGDFVLDTDAVYYSGKGLITSLSLSAGSDEVASSSISITGSGSIKQNNY